MSQEHGPPPGVATNMMDLAGPRLRPRGGRLGHALWACLAVCAVLALGLAALERFQADGYEWRMRPVRQLAAARAMLRPEAAATAPSVPATVPDVPARQRERAAWLHGLERLAVQGSIVADGAEGIPNSIAVQAQAVHGWWAAAALSQSPGQPAAGQPALAPLVAEIDRVEAIGTRQLALLRERQQRQYAIGWALLVASLLACGAVMWRQQRQAGALGDALQAEDARHRAHLDILPQLIWVCDVQAHAQFLNQRWVRYSGVPLAQLLGTGWLDLIHPQDRAQVLQVWADALANGGDTVPDFRLRRHDGNYRWFSARFGASRDEADGPVRWFGTSADVDDVRRTHEALQQSEQFHRSTLSALNEGVITFDSRGRVGGANPAAQRLLGMRVEDMMRSPPAEWGLDLRDEHGEPVAPERTPLARVLATGQSCRDELLSLRLRDGTQRWVCVNVEPVHDPQGRLSAAVCSFDDITAQQHARLEQQAHRDALEQQVHARTHELTAVLHARTEVEQRLQGLDAQLREAERFARVVADSVPGRLAYWDRALRCRFVNRAQLEWFGEAAHHVLGRTLREIRGDAQADAMMPFATAALAGQEQEVEQVEHSVRGVRADTRVQYIPDRREGKVQGFVVLASNITQHRQVEQLLRVRNEQLVQSRDRADAANQAKSTFLANMSHEIRTPMNAILGFTHMLRREIEDESQQQRLDRIAGAAGHLLQILNNILDLSKIEAGKLTLDRVEFSLDGLLSRTSALVIESVRDKGLQFDLHRDPLPDRLIGDPTRLMQALLNLLSNAVKFTDAGRVALYVQPVAQQADGVEVRFEVRDTGLGIAAADLEHLFNPFAQADASSTRRYGGTGLGLAITRRLAEQMDGDAGAQSQPGQGSRFWFTARLGVVSAQADPPAEVPALHGLRALVAADQADARAALVALVGALGLQVDAVASGTRAIEQVAQAAAGGAPYDLVLLDWAMPGLDGIETGARLQEALPPPRAMVLVSARDRASIHQLAREAGFGSVLLKPVAPSMLRDALLRLLVRRTDGTASGPAGALDAGAWPEATAEVAAQRKAGALAGRVLLAEDNPVNQEVAVQLLQAAGVAVDVASDGQQALDMARAQPYDLVLMDMQMPRMDGLQATRAIRALPALARLPIVAMTANAFPEDRQACLDAGMNDHLAKPVDPRVLHAALARWLPARAVDAGMPVPGDAPTAVPPATAPVRDAAPTVVPPAAMPVPGPAPTAVPPGPAPRPAEQIVDAMAGLIDLPKALEFSAGQPDILLRVLQQFVRHYQGAGATLAAQLDAGDTGGPARTLHSLRGVTGMIGAGRLREMVVTLEAALAPGADAAQLRAQAEGFCSELDRLVAAVAQRLPAG
jgi:two-component system sensor histidine kinase/response regulator